MVSSLTLHSMGEENNLREASISQWNDKQNCISKFRNVDAAAKIAAHVVLNQRRALGNETRVDILSPG